MIRGIFELSTRDFRYLSLYMRVRFAIETDDLGIGLVESIGDYITFTLHPDGNFKEGTFYKVLRSTHHPILQIFQRNLNPGERPGKTSIRIPIVT